MYDTKSYIRKQASSAPVYNKDYFKWLIDYLIQSRNKGVITDQQFSSLIVEVSSIFIEGKVIEKVESRFAKNIFEGLHRTSLKLKSSNVG